MKHVPSWRRRLRLVGVLWFLLIPHFVAPHSNAPAQIHMLVKVWSGHFAQAVKLDPDVPTVSDRSQHAPCRTRRAVCAPVVILPEHTGQEVTYPIRNESDRAEHVFILAGISAPLVRLL
jgi:hypothetical protein